MSFQILPDKTPSIIGRIGKGFAKGLAEQVPKEVERHRLSSGLKQFADKSDNPLMKQYAELLGIPGITPQAVQTFGELAKHQANRQAYSGRRDRKQQTRTRENIENPVSPENQQQIRDVEFGGMNKGRQKSTQESPSAIEGNVPNQYAQAPNAGQQGDYSEKFVPKTPWSFDRTMDERADLYDEFPNATQEKIDQLVKEKEERELALPEAEQRRNEFYRNERKEAEKEFDRLKQVKFQKKGEETYQDLPGEYENNTKKEMIRDMRRNNLTREQAADKWTEIALDQAKAIGALKSLANESYFSQSPSTVLDKLKGYQKIFSKGGNSERIFNELQRGYDKTTGRYEGFDLTPQRSAQVMYPVSPKIKDYIKNIKKSRPDNPTEWEKNSIKHAENLEGMITGDDSWLSIAAHLQDQDPYFDENSFFRTLRQDEDTLLKNPRLSRELNIGEQGVKTSWGNLWLFSLYPKGIK